MKRSKPQRMNFRFEENVRSALETIAYDQDLTMTEVIERLVTKYAKRNKYWPTGK
jgi:hypothetical protein